MSHSCFIHSSIDGHLGCFHILVIVNNAAVNIGVLMFFQISVLGSFRYIPRSGIAGSKGRSIFNFFEVSPYYFPQWLHQSAFPPTLPKGSPFSTSSPTLFVCWFLDDSHFDRCEVISHCCFTCSSIDGHLVCFHILVTVNNAAMNIGVLMFFQISVLGSFRYIPRSGSLGCLLYTSDAADDPRVV